MAPKTSSPAKPDDARLIQDSPAELSFEFLDKNLLEVIRTAHNHPFRGYKDRVDALRLAYEILAFRQEQRRTGVSSIGSAPESDSAAAPPFYIPHKKRGADGIFCSESEKVEERLLGQGSTGGGCIDGGTTPRVGAKDDGTGDGA